MARMLDLRDVFELVNDGLNNRSFAQQQFVRKVHQMILHVFAQPGDELEPVFKEQLREGSSIMDPRNCTMEEVGIRYTKA
jgi:hypothetical protein